MTETELWAAIDAEQSAPRYGWCGPDKARSLARSVLDGQPAVCVEVGVFGGASLVPVALALACVGSGHAYGVDPWHKETALEGVAPGPDRDWWNKVDLGAAKRHCEGRLAALGLAGVCTLLGMRSEAAVGRFADGTVGLLHLDGGHTEAAALRDVTLWLPKVAPGGVVYLDDVAWREGGRLSVLPALAYLLANGCAWRGLVGDCAVLRKG